VSVKDLIDVEGTPTTAASRVLPGTPALHDAPVTRRLREAGAVFLGKTNLHEFAFGTTSEDSAFGAVRNPLDLSRIAGGSSGGSAAAVASGIGLGSVGTDTGGSIRIPASLCGLVGLKPSYGEVPAAGVVPLCASFDHVGPIARTVADAWTMWEVMSGAGAGARPSATVRELRLGVPQPYFLDMLDDGVREAFERALDVLQRAGAAVSTVSIPSAPQIPAAYVPIVFRESWAWHQRFIDAVPDRYTPAVRARLEMGRNVSADDYARAMAIRALLADEVNAALTGVDAIVLPAMPVSAPRLGTTEIAFGERVEPVRALMLRLTQLFNITGHPAVTMPMPATGLPAGLQLAGARAGTARLLAMAEAIEAALA
jgi:aspartyl-tRNA(Asn)/glutamyl-tRNA(Gln) amidotransferase subunit A